MMALWTMKRLKQKQRMNRRVRQRKLPDSSSNQSARFIEAAKQAGADESGKTFERAFKRIVKPKKSSLARKRAK